MPRICPGCTLAVVTLLGCVASSADAASAPKVTKADFAAIFQRDPVQAITLSPDGRHLAYLMNENGRDLISIVDVDFPETRATIRVTGNRFLGWVDAGTLIYAPRLEVRGVNADGTGDRKLVNDEDISAGTVRRVPEVLELVPSLPGKFLVGGWGLLPPATASDPVSGGSTTTFPNAVDYYLIDAKDGRRTHVLARDYEGRALGDQRGEIRLYEGPTAIHYKATQPVHNLDVRAVLPNPSYDYWQMVPQGFAYLSAKDGMWHDFDETIGNEAKLKFQIHPDEFFGERSVPLVFGQDPNVLYFASNVGRDKFGIYALNLETRRQTDFAVEDPVYDLASPDDALSSRVLIFERSGRLVGLTRPDGTRQWFAPEMTRLQEALERQFRGRAVRQIEWNLARDRVLVLVSTASDPGRYFVYDAKTRIAAEFLRRTGALALEKMGMPAPIEFDSPSGVHLTGTVTQPRNPAINPPPLVLYCRDFPSTAPKGGFSPDAQALAAMGFVVAEINHRGMIGFGRRHLNAVMEGIDVLPIEDLRATVEWIAGRQPIDRSRIAIVGEGMGGFLAVRALELFPDYFRCAVCLNAPVSPADWAYASLPDRTRGDDANERQQSFLRKIPNLSSYSATSNAASITKPVLIMQERLRNGMPDTIGPNLRAAIESGKGDVEYKELTVGFKARVAAARADAYLEIADFMRSSLYDFNVQIGPVRAIK